jgi:hypothetical protein
METRVTALESQVSELTGRVQRTAHDAAAARVLAGGADRDVEEVRGEIRDFRQATTSSFNALREDMVDLRTRVGSLETRVDNGFAKIDRRFAEMDRNFAQVDRNFAQVDNNFLTVRGRLDAAAAGQQHIVDLLTTMMRQHGAEPES